ncbi:MAG TPA: alpha/beta family hydrolase [Thermoanaerobaculia bacterium]|nr:alpha/beta family hydrolase [Thermoanaerobaculia bacterium]
MDWLWNGPEDGPLIALAHGAGAPMDSPSLEALAKGLAAEGLRVARFEFPYMKARRTGGRRGAPDREPVLLDTWRTAVAELGGGPSLVIGGRSMGGRMASRIADEVGARGLVCLGYPFHPPGKLEQTRTAHLEHLRTPTLVVQGTRDPFGTPDEVAGYRLSPAIRIVWLEDGDHSFKPRVSSGRTERQNLQEAVDAVAGFVRSLP